MTLSLPLDTFFIKKTLFSHSILFSITCTSLTGGIMMNRRQLWWCKHHYQGYEQMRNVLVREGISQA